MILDILYKSCGSKLIKFEIEVESVSVKRRDDNRFITLLSFQQQRFRGIRIRITVSKNILLIFFQLL